MIQTVGVPTRRGDWGPDSRKPPCGHTERKAASASQGERAQRDLTQVDTLIVGFLPLEP